jgi:thiol:disulfide interchange protein
MQLLILAAATASIALKGGTAAGAQYRSMMPMMSQMNLGLLNLAVLIVAMIAVMFNPVGGLALAAFGLGWSTKGQSSVFITGLAVVTTLYGLFRIGGISVGGDKSFASNEIDAQSSTPDGLGV